ncbi:hypothetical protein B7486_78030, partial [cyanobacterium TDX16]
AAVLQRRPQGCLALWHVRTDDWWKVCVRAHARASSWTRRHGRHLLPRQVRGGDRRRITTIRFARAVPAHEAVARSRLTIVVTVAGDQRRTFGSRRSDLPTRRLVASDRGRPDPDLVAGSSPPEAAAQCDLRFCRPALGRAIALRRGGDHRRSVDRMLRVAASTSSQVVLRRSV